MRPRLPSWMRSRNSMPRPTYRLAIDTTRRRLASISFFLASWPCRSVRWSSRSRVGVSLRPLSVALSISAASMFSSCRCCRMLSICSAETSTGARASMTSSLVRKPRSLPLVTRSRTSSICASLAMAICSGTSRSVRRQVGAPGSHLGGALGEIPVAFWPRLPQGSPSRLEGDELFEGSSVLVRPLHRVKTLQGPLELVDDAGEAELLQPTEYLVSVPPVFLGRERLHGQAAQEAAVGLGGGGLPDGLEGLRAGPAAGPGPR